MLVPLNPAEHRWRQSKIDPRITERRAVGVESFLGRKNANYMGQNDLRIRVELSVSNTTPSLATLKEKLEATMMEMRFLHPESACTLAWDKVIVPPLLQYRSPESQEAAKKWAQGIVHVQATTDNALDLWEDIENRRRSNPQPENPITVHILANVADVDSPLPVDTIVDMLFRMNHVYWDGVSARAFVGDVLRTFSKTLAADYEVPGYEWGKETANLNIPILDALKPGVECSGDAFTADRSELLKAFGEGHADLGTRPHTGPYKPRVVTHVFAPKECSAMIKAIKSRLGPKYTITHLGQAAVTQAMLEINPPSPDLPESAAFVTPNSINGRRWMDNAYAPTYYAACLANGVVKFNNVKSLIIDPSDKPAMIQALTKGAEDAKKSIDFWLSKPHHLPVGINVHNLSAEFVATNPAEEKEVAVPVFLSDGLNDRFLPNEIVRSDTNKPLMTVNGVLFALNEYDPFYTTRLESWQGASTLSVCYNGGNYSKEEAEAFLHCVVKYMLAFVGA
ncbi:15-O-acetyltransferase Tri3 [Aspergillus alliaceus]|uniref:15-O-acetyltransferase Tri3 n=1 Tax=Petromyces alliaceus TaxID=209559 RepID=UPI0012A5A36B|nr:15-O-acetyltransferase Tri3 [Aspergillus alliaceus]KAB8235866.1 15-O-acetyltransferase Tri3 [Aspergillus alliaceus]